MSVVDRPPRLWSWPYFLAWVVVGTALASGLLSILTIGLPILVVAGAAAAGLVLTGRTKAEMVGLVCGLGVTLLYIAFLNRSGPGNVCTTTTAGSHCTEQWNRYGWAMAGILLLLAGAMVFFAAAGGHDGGDAVFSHGRADRI